MNPFTLLFRLPLMPLTGVVRLGEILRDQAEQELYDPAAVRRQLEEAEKAQASGEMSAEEAARVQSEAVSRLVPSPQTTEAADPAPGNRS